MIPSAEQERVLKIARAAKRPLAWLGGVRAGKTVGAAMALIERIQSHPGDYAVTAYSWSNLERNIIPALERHLQDEGHWWHRRKQLPKHIEMDCGKIHFFVAGDAGADKDLQGMTLRGAVSDEVLLCHRSFLMQLVARFTHDAPFWLMTANKTDPAHWLNAEWLETGLVLSVNSNSDQNPHLSDDAKGWWNLINGAEAARMLDNDWASTYSRILETTCPTLYDADDDNHSIRWASVWLDDARGHALVRGSTTPLRSRLIATEWLTTERIQTIEEIMRKDNRAISVCSQPRGTYPFISRCAFVPPSLERIAEGAARRPGLVHLESPDDELARTVRAWSWDAPGKPGKADPRVWALALAACMFGATVAPMTQGDTL